MAERLQSNNIVKDKAEAFALRIVRLYQFLQAKQETVMSKQILRSGTSIGANITEGHYASSKADFINKYSIAQKEAAETLYWLNLLTRAEYFPDDDNTKSVVSDCDEILRLLIASIKTARDNVNGV